MKKNWVIAYSAPASALRTRTSASKSRLGALGVLVGERGHADGEGRRATAPAPPARRRGRRPPGAAPTAGPGRPAGRRAGRGRCGCPTADRRPDHAAQLGHGVTDAGQVRQRRQRRLARDPLGHPDGPVAGRAAGAVGHRDEGRVHLLDPPDRLPQHRFAGVVPRREELEADARQRPGERSGDRPGEVLGPRQAGADRHTAQGTLASPEWAGATRSRAGTVRTRTLTASRRLRHRHPGRPAVTSPLDLCDLRERGSRRPWTPRCRSSEPCSRPGRRRARPARRRGRCASSRAASGCARASSTGATAPPAAPTPTPWSGWRRRWSSSRPPPCSTTTSWTAATPAGVCPPPTGVRGHCTPTRAGPATAAASASPRRSSPATCASSGRTSCMRRRGCRAPSWTAVGGPSTRCAPS